MPSLPSELVQALSGHATALTAAWTQKQQSPTAEEVATAYGKILTGLIHGCGKLRGTEES